MTSKPKTRNIQDFFTRDIRSVPAKRPSPSLEDAVAHDDSVRTRKKHAKLRTPKTAHRFKDVNPSPVKSPFTLSSSIAVAYRSPRPKHSKEPARSFSSVLSAGYDDRPAKGKHNAGSSTPAPLQQLSFADLPGSTQRVVKNGNLVAVLGSDDDDSDSLPSLDDLLGSKKGEPATPSSSPPELDETDAETQRKRSLFVFTNGRSQPLIGKDKLRELNSRGREYKVNIGALVGAHFEDDEIETNIANAKKGYEAVKQEQSRQAEHDERVLVSFAAGEPGDEDDISRLMNAVDRTEALSHGKTWSFFGPGGLRSQQARPLRPPIAEHSNAWSERCLRDTEARGRAFLSGYVAENWSYARMPDEFIVWTFDSIIQEPRSELRRSYVKALSSLDSASIQAWLDSERIEEMFLHLGASQQSLDCDIIIEPNCYLPKVQGVANYKALLSTIEVLTALAPSLEVSVHSRLLAIVARLALDAGLMNDARVSSAVEDSLSKLIETSQQKGGQRIATSLVADLGTHLNNATLQAQLLRHILCTSCLAATTRIQLAQEFLLHTGSNINHNDSTHVDSLVIDIDVLTSYLHSGPFDTTVRSMETRPDYTKMTALTQLLDIAIADGGRPASFESRAEEVAFNRKIDTLADRVKAVFASIADTGASHMRRTEAKEALNVLHYRLLYAIRTEPRPKKNVFGGQDGEEYRTEERSKGFMAQYLARKKGRKVSQDSDDVMSNGLGQASKSESEELIRRQLQLDE